ncbi:MAG: PKD domain-containing protein [Planctomycetota bacterium]|jgi:murein DD-endopeptidase MepM/ murein hydrolase activator NlpD
MKRSRRSTPSLAILLLGSAVAAAAGEPASVEPLLRVVDLNVGQEAEVVLSNGKTATLKLLDLEETRDELRNAVRRAEVTVEINGRKATLVAAFYRLPVTVGDVQVDCAVTKGCVQEGKNPWALDADARLRLWPAGSPWIRPGTFTYPLNQRWFASDTQMANDPVYVDGGENPARKSIYYHWGLDMGGAEGLADVYAATDGVVMSAGKEAAQSNEEDSPVRPRYDVIYLRDARGWYYRYSHLFSIDPAVKVGARVRQGQKIGVLGKEGGSGGWSHLHFDVSSIQPSGRYGITEGYAFIWQVYHAAHKTKLQAVARPHHVAWAGDRVTLDGTRSWSHRGPQHIKSLQWTFTDGIHAAGSLVERRYDKPGTYSETLKVTDAEGNVDYDFAVVQVIDRQKPDQIPPSIHAVYYPTLDIKAGDEVTFKVRSFRVRPDEGHELWDFGDGTPKVEVQSDGNAETHAKDGYAVTTHRYARPGHYLVSVRRTNDRGETATGRLHVRVGE